MVRGRLNMSAPADTFGTIDQRNEVISMDKDDEKLAPTPESTRKEEMFCIVPGFSELRFLPLIALCAGLGWSAYVLAWAVSIPVSP